jgi:hypothetical protein
MTAVGTILLGTFLTGNTGGAGIDTGGRAITGSSSMTAVGTILLGTLFTGTGWSTTTGSFSTIGTLRHESESQTILLRLLDIAY